jgi:ankyrin repeat protein
MEGNTSLQFACKNGHHNCVKELLLHQKINPAHDDNIALLIACKHGHDKVVEVLLNDKRVDPTGTHNWYWY